MITDETKISDEQSALDVSYRQDKMKTPRPKVLLLDDGSSTFTLLRWQFKNSGCNVTAAPDGQSAYFELRNEHFDILITDLVVLDLSLCFLLETGKRLNPEMIVIVITDTPELLPLLLPDTSIADGLLTKPFSINGLKSLLPKC